MTASNLTLSRVGYCERLENLGLNELLRVGQDGSGMAPTAAETTLGITAGDIASQALELALRGYVTFRRSFTCSTNDTVTLELVARGMTADAGFVRRIDVEGFAVDDAGGAFFKRIYMVEGASTPVVTQTGGAGGMIFQQTNGLLTDDIDAARTLQAAAEAQTLALAGGSGTVTATYTGQSGDVTNGYFDVKVFPKAKVTYE